MSRAATAIAVACATLVLCAVATGSGISPAEPARGQAASGPELGIVMPSSSRELAELAPALELARLRSVWNRVQPSCAAIRRGRYDWRETDRIVERFAGRGVPLLMTVRGGPDCALERDRQGNPREPQRRYRAAFARWAGKVVARYGPAARRGGAGGCCGVELLEVWNEPNLGVKWTNPDGREYGRFLKLVSRQVRRAEGDDGVRIISGGVTSNTAVEFLREMHSVSGVERAYDEVGLHTYNATAAGALERIDAVRRSLNARGDGAPIAITEHGWSTCAEPSAEFNGKCVTRAEQAMELESLVRGLEAAPQLGVERFLWFMPQDSGEPANERLCPTQPKFFYGFFDRLGEPKPSWAVWRELTGAEGAPESLEPWPSGDLEDCDKFDGD